MADNELVHAAASLLSDVGPIGCMTAACEPSEPRPCITLHLRNVTCDDCVRLLADEGVN